MHNETVLRLGVFGGTFNPPHSGHAGAASACVEQLRLDKLLLIPTRQPPHKALPKDSATAQQRLEMVKLLAEDLPKTEACDLEIRRGGTSYTWQTMQQLTEEFPRAMGRKQVEHGIAAGCPQRHMIKAAHRAKLMGQFFCRLFHRRF